MFSQLKKELGINSRNYFIETHHKTHDFYHNFKKFNEKIGLPRLPSTGQTSQLMPYQLKFFKLIDKSKPQKFHINKSRQIGVTELILRILAFHCFNKYEGGKILIIAGTRINTAGKIMHRFKQLFSDIPGTVLESNHVLKLKLVNGTEIEALPSNSDAIRGDTKIRAILVDEAAHFNLNDDSVVLDAIQPIVFTNKADLFLVSTPNGPRGFFYHLADEENDYHKLEFDFHCAVGYIYSEEDIEKELERKDIDVDQEYLCKFTVGRDSYFGPITAEHEDASIRMDE